MHIIINLFRKGCIGVSHVLWKFGIVTTEKQHCKKNDENSSHGNTFIVLVNVIYSNIPKSKNEFHAQKIPQVNLDDARHWHL